MKFDLYCDARSFRPSPTTSATNLHQGHARHEGHKRQPLLGVEGSSQHYDREDCGRKNLQLICHLTAWVAGETSEGTASPVGCKRGA
jgi:hypothetical protein